MKKTYILKLNDDAWAYSYRRQGKKIASFQLCAEGLKRLFDICDSDKFIEIVVQSYRPKGEDYQVIHNDEFWGYPSITDSKGFNVIFPDPVDRELDKFGSYPLFVSVYALK